jgi:hypothetical protein
MAKFLAEYYATQRFLSCQFPALQGCVAMKKDRKGYQFIFISVLLLSPVHIWGEEPSHRERPQNVIEEFDVAKCGDVLVVPITIQKRKYAFVLDSGSTTSVFDNSLRGLVGKNLGKQKGSSLTGDVTLNLHQTPKVCLGQMNFHEGAMAAIADLSWIASLTGYEIKGFLGMDFLGSYVLQINFDQGKLSFLRSPGNDPGVAIPLIIEEDLVPMVDLNIPNWGTERFVLDTGAVSGNGSIRKDLFVRLFRNRRLQIIGGAAGIGLAGKGEYPIGRLDQIELGEFKQADLIFGIAPDNVLGLQYLSRYEITFDFPNRKMYMKKGARFSAPDELDKSGMDIRRKEGKIIVEEVAERSPAAEAGIRPKDRILKIGDKSTDESTLNDIHRLLSSGDKEISVQLRRDGEEIDLALLLKDYASDYARAWEATLKSSENTFKPAARMPGRLFGRRR